MTVSSHNLNVNLYFWPKKGSAFPQGSIAIVNSDQNSILYIGRIFWNCNITHLIHIAYTISSAIAADFWGPRQESFLPSAVSLSNKHSASVERTCNLARQGNIWNEFNLFQAHKADFWNKMRTTIEIIDIEILIKELEEIKVWIGIIKFLIEIKKTEEIIVL